MARGSTRYVRVGDADLAYQVTGSGPFDLVYLRGLFSNVDLQWDVPPLARALERLGSFSRLITFDRRGVGVSDRVSPDAIGSWERWVEDLLAVLEVTSSDRPAILAEFDAAPVAQLFAATYPERVRALVMWNGFARLTRAPGYPIGWAEEQHEALVNGLAAIWGTDALAETSVPEHRRTPAMIAEIAKFHRGAATPGTVRAMLAFQSAMDTREVIGTIRLPTLVLAREEWPAVPLELGRFVAEATEGARLVTYAGSMSTFWGDDDADDIIAEIETFLTGSKPAVPADRVLATIVFTDIVSSTERASSLGDRAWRSLLDTHDEIVSSGVTAFRGSLVKTTGDGMLATFDGPARAIACASALRRELAGHDLRIRAGVHCGEIELRGDGDIGGVAVHIAARVAAAAEPGEILCSRTVKDLTVGSSIGFEERGIHVLKGVSTPWELYAAHELSAAAQRS